MIEKIKTFFSYVIGGLEFLEPIYYLIQIVSTAVMWIVQGILFLASLFS
ncbi:hypothetical protein KMW28_19045 [Flammeovirga yaeyamensis]|uniref:Uncharacterized protein n=1 Tax=Flammeovirga yaeyamensis TaxID=367791 RepID=A0AAX1N742_9BACT|nr:hypothetical protein [Flammeovirga yaeyamensis]MBB3700716.1 VIT1/CCC1 family predicted Fe2+/Mn2+ transporter [Flammeovirga yaeyamensis]NMF37926.1 hypothetical protein [Flammeovirga yaeyamensis]QWG01713.1 hypothetical protein KMW28_19045 [Flammeovirga yaeyamensis]